MHAESLGVAIQPDASEPLQRTGAERLGSAVQRKYRGVLWNDIGIDEGARVRLDQEFTLPADQKIDLFVGRDPAMGFVRPRPEKAHLALGAWRVDMDRCAVGPQRIKGPVYIDQ